jgi:hypothetical protein
MKRGLQLVVLAALLGIVTSAHASLLRAMGLAELVSRSDRIVVGKVVAVTAAWDPRHLKIISSIELEIAEAWKGPEAGSRRVTIVQPGGSVGEIEMTVHGMPSFAVGETSLLFLRGQGHFQVVGMGQGKRLVTWDKAGKQWLAHGPDADGVVDVGPDAKLSPAKPSKPIPLTDLRAQVMREIGKSP